MPAKKTAKKKTVAKKAPAKKSAAPKALKCPRDGKALERVGKRAGEFCCNACDGFWISGKAISKESATGLIKLPVGILDNLKPAKANALKCPEDGSKLSKIKIERKNVKADAVVMDACPACKGIWFDQTEYGHVITKKGDVPAGPGFLNSVLVFLSQIDKR